MMNGSTAVNPMLAIKYTKNAKSADPHDGDHANNTRIARYYFLQDPEQRRNTLRNATPNQRCYAHPPI